MAEENLTLGHMADALKDIDDKLHGGDIPGARSLIEMIIVELGKPNPGVYFGGIRPRPIWARGVCQVRPSESR